MESTKFAPLTPLLTLASHMCRVTWMGSRACFAGAYVEEAAFCEGRRARCTDRCVLGAFFAQNTSALSFLSPELQHTVSLSPGGQRDIPQERGAIQWEMLGDPA